MTATMIEPTTTLTYPISPDYVKAGHGGTGWTVQRAIAEFIANALDEDANASVTYANGILTIEDNGPGIPEEGLLLGYSPKGDAQIGQFGEGSKIGALVLARDESVGAIHIETVGYAFIPTVERRRVLDGVAPRRSDDAPEVLVYSFYPSSRTQGTKVTVQVPKKVATEAMARFRHLAEAGYTAPTTAQVITNGPKGRLYIGGVLVSTQKNLLASYDFPLADAKTAQNRDRSVIDAETVNRLVSDALAACQDIDVHRAFVEHALDGGRIAEAERYFWAAQDDPRVVAMFRQIARERFAGQAVYYTTGEDAEAAASMQDGDTILIQTKLDWQSNHALMALLNVQVARVARQNLVKQERNATKYVADSRLTAAERDVLGRAKDMVASIFGKDAFGTVRVYTATGRYLACANGFYTPESGNIALHRDILPNFNQTLETLLHEVAHRLAHQGGREYSDRTRGFERELGNMLAHVVKRLSGATPTDVADDVAEADVETVKVAQVSYVAENTPETPAEREVLAEVANARFEVAKVTYDVTRGTALMSTLGLYTSKWALFATARHAGWRKNPSQMAPSMITDFREVEVIAGALGISAPAMWLAHNACEAHGYGKKDGRIDGPWKRKMADNAPLVASALRASGQVDDADLVERHAAGLGEPAELRDLALRLITTERDGGYALRA